jgi:ribose/xylose/arabinose/galactoside ABC-type transport system permease subunit
MKFLKIQWARALVGLVALLLLGSVLAPRSVSGQVLVSLLPFIGILGVAAIGQHLVIQQRGFDLSVAGVMSLSAAMISALVPSDAGIGVTLGYVALALAMGACVGFLNGLMVTVIRVPALVTTIGSNAALLGITLYVTQGTPSAAPDSLKAFAVSSLWGMPWIFAIMVLCTVVASVTLARTVTGRRFVAVGVNPTAADVLAIPVNRYRRATYTLAGLLFAVAGVMLGAFLNTPNVFSGNAYMLTTVAAVVVGGSPLNGDRGSLLATVIGAAFLIFLDQLVLSLGFNQSVQNVVQALIVLAGVALPEVVRKQSLRRRA